MLRILTAVGAILWIGTVGAREAAAQATQIGTVDPGVQNEPWGLNFNRTFGEVYVTDTHTGRLLVFDLDFNFLRTITMGGPSYDGGIGVVRDPVSGDFFMSSFFNRGNRVLRFDSSGNFISDFPVPGGSIDLAIDPLDQTLFVTVFPNPWKVQEYTFDGTLVSSFFVPTIPNPVGIAFDAASRTLLISQSVPERVVEFTLDGTLIGEFLPSEAVPFNGLGIDYDCATGNLYIGGQDTKLIFVYNDPSRPTCLGTIDVFISDPNSVNPNRNKGLISVAILTTETFDAQEVDPATVRFGPDEARIAHSSSHLEDVDGDTDTDLLLHFRTQETGIQCGDTEATLSGFTFDGTEIQGSNSIKTVGCK